MNWISFKKISALSIALIVLTIVYSLSFLHAQSIGYGVMTFNIRYDNPDDGINRWSDRKIHVMEIIQWYRPEICGMQEVLHHQLEELKLNLSDYEAIGVGRNDGKMEGEFCPVFFRKSRFSLMEQNTLWLSESPSIPGKSWDAALPRIVTWVKLWDKVNECVIFVFNTHFDHVGEKARSESARIIHKKVAEITGDHTYMIMGDLNLTPDQEPVKYLSQHYIDAYQATISHPFGPLSTFTGFKPAEVPGNRIDYIFLPSYAKVIKYATLSHTWDGRFASDHHPVYCEFTTTK